jgi:hypothetical protein
MPVQDWSLWRRAPWLFTALRRARAHARRTGLAARRTVYKVLWRKINYHEDGLATEHNAEFTRDPRFVEAYALGKATGSWGERDIRWRAYVACWAASHAVRLEGDFVECGVNRGGLSRTVMHFVGFERLDKRFFLLDTFAGIPEKSISAEEWALGRRPGGYAACFDAVQRTFAGYGNAELVRGVIPDTLTSVDTEKICYLSIDMNCVAPEIAAAEYFWQKMVSGGIMLLDDYSQMPFLPQKRAFDAFAARHGVMVLGLPTGQGIIIKP